MSDQPPDNRAVLKSALQKLEKMQARLDAAEGALHEPLAIVGLGLRFPGGANDATSFWELLLNGVDAISEVPPDRWDIDAFYDPDPDAPGKMYTRWGGFLENIDGFDPQFFGISPREAQSMDPQQRLLLETTWEALENAGRAPDKLAGSRTGVYVGMVATDYANLKLAEDDAYDIDAYFGTGVSRSVAAGRIAYTFNFHGPAVTIDTACSSALMAVHQACQSLRVKECDMAVAGGVNLMLEPLANVSTSRGRMMSFDGRCKTFDAAADGYVRSDGCAMIVLKRLSDALAEGDNILSVILGSASNQDGRSNGLTAPNGKAQEAVIRAALADGKVAPADVSYVEAHGTGTTLGDPIEVRALGAVYGQGRSRHDPLRVGSVKTNVGHLEAAAGIAGLVKVVLSLQHKTIPPHLHLRNPNPYIPWDSLPVIVPTEPTPWPAPEDKRRLAGLSSFGFSGTNVHMIIGEPPAPEPKLPQVAPPYHLLPLSARSNTALQQVARQYAGYLRRNDDLALADVAFSAGAGRAHFNERLAIVADSTAAARDKLTAWLAGEQVPGLVSGTSDAEKAEVVFLFTGQGSQYVGMGRQLYETQPTFRAALDECQRLLRPHLERPLLEVMFGGEEAEAEATAALQQTAYTQPALFALEYGLARLWQSWGVQPAAVLGHSVGEYVAACIAGVFSLEDGLRLIAARGRLMGALPPGGRIAAVFAVEAAVAEAIKGYETQVSIGAVNGPENVVISGDGEAVGAIVAGLAERGIKSRELAVSHAFHSPLMEPMLGEFERVAAGVSYQRPRLGVVSNVSGRLVSDDSLGNAAYWREHVRAPVRFAAGIAALEREGYRHFVEIGPGAVLTGMGQRCWAGEEEALWLPSLRPGRDDWSQLLDSLGRLYVRGVAIDWESAALDAGGRRIPLPTYPFQRERYWMDLSGSRGNGRVAFNGEAINHPLLHERLPAALPIFQTRLSTAGHPYLAEHRIHGVTLLPATAYVELALAAVADALKGGPFVLADVILHEVLPLPQHSGRAVQLVLTPEENGARFQIFSREDDQGTEPANVWRLHASGRVIAPEEETPPGQVKLKQMQAALKEAMPVDSYYEHLAAVGADYGPAFRGLRHIARRDGEALGHVVLPDTAEDKTDAYHLHPALLDACFQLLGAAVPGASLDNEHNHVYVPVGIERVRVYDKAAVEVWCRAEIAGGDPGAENLSGDLTLFTTAGAIVARVTGLRLQRVSRQTLQRAVPFQLEEWFYDVQWLRQARGAATIPYETPGRWLLFADDGGVAAALANHLQGQGEACDLVYPGDDFASRSDGTWLVNPLRGADFTQLLAATAQGERPLLRGIVHLWSVDDSLSGDAALNTVQEVQARNCGSVLHLAQALSQLDQAPRLWLVTRGAQPAAGVTVNAVQAPLWGLGNVLALEHPELRCVRLDLDSAEKGALSLYQEVWGGDDEDQIALRGSGRYVARLAPRAAAGISSPRPVRLEIGQRGVLDNLTLQPLARRTPGPGEVEIAVYATGLNFRDVLNALDMYPGDAGPLGSECAGRVVAVGEGVEQLQVGDEVIALALESFSSYVTIPAVLCVPKPATMSFVEAATVPITFLTADYALNRLAQMKAGDRVLIHAAAGGVGLAAVQLAQRAGAEIFATAGSDEKRSLLRSLGVQHVMDSRTLDFAGEIMTLTDGQGVDIVLNSLAGEFITRSLDALGPGGRFVEIGKTGVWDEQQVQESRPDVAYFVLYLGEITASDPELIREMLLGLLRDFEAGHLRPLPQQVFPLREAVEAFRFMAQARHVGKIVLMQEPPAPPFKLHTDGTYLISGGLGGLGLEFARWLAEQGARHLVLMGRSAPTAAVQQTLHELAAMGVEVEVAQADVSQREQVAAVVARVAASMPPLRGLIHAAGLLDDGLLRQQNWERFARVTAPKIDGAWNLHTLTRDLPLDFFVLFSAGAALLGSPSQGNYAAANAFLDALAHARRAQGLPALSVNWGAWSDVGMAAALGETNLSRWAAQGVHLIAPQQGVQALQLLLQQGATQAAVLPMNWGRFGQQSGGVRPFLTQLVQPATQRAVEREAARPLSQLMTHLGTLPADERRRQLSKYVHEEARKVLGLVDVGQMESNRLLLDMGLDSLMAVELRNSLSAGTGLKLPATLTFDYPSITAISDHLAQLLWGAESPSIESPARAAVVANEPIAVIGLGCRIPGGADNPAAFWSLLTEGFDAITEVPPERWDVDAYYDPDPDAEGKMYTRYGAFLRGIDQFEPQFFNMSPREAIGLDPQQRLLLEVAWEALEHAGQAPTGLIGSQTGVFVGISGSDFLHLFTEQNDPTLMSTYVSTGNAHSVAAGRLSYLLGLQGPSMAVDTACSSSLVAVHLACQSLRTGEADLALAGGVNAILTPQAHIIFSRARMMAPDGHCKTFDAAADGYVRGEGAGMVVLKRLSDALADGDNILALIRGSAVNQDGHSNGLTAPNGVSQEAVLRAALANAGVEPAAVDYVEAHGTGTSLGDPIEARALGTVYGAGREAGRNLIVGSVKTNVGHLESAAGVAGLIKVILSLYHGVIPRHLHFQEPNPLIPWEELPLEVPTTARPWPENGGGRRIAGITSFGFSGTNAHIIVEEAAREAQGKERGDEGQGGERPLHLLALSANSEKALRELARRYEQHTALSEAAVADVAYTANSGRSHFRHRLAVIAADHDELRQQLTAFAAEESGSSLRGALLRGDVARAGDRRVAFLFTGQGSQYVGMGRQLYETQPTFRAALDECQRLLRPHLERPLLEVMFGGEETEAEATTALQQTAYTQPALFALEYGLARLWQSWGVQPAAVLGHSVGEYVAACIAGVFSLEDGLRLIAARGRLMGALPSGGRMAAVFADEEAVAEAITPYMDVVSIGAVNGPENVVISGDGEAVGAIVAGLAERGIKSRELAVSHAFHSPLMEPMLGEFERVAAGVSYQRPRLGVVSNVSGRLVSDDSLGNAAYWGEHVRAPVRFAAGIAALEREGYRHFVEIGPGAVLTSMGQRCWAGEEEALWLPSLRPGRDDWSQLLDSLGRLYVQGIEVDWRGFDGDYDRRKVALPTYPFQRERYWPELADKPATPSRPRVAQRAGDTHPLLGQRLRSPVIKETLFTAHLDAQWLPFLADHKVYGATVFPATAYVEMGLAMAAAAYGEGRYIITEMDIREALVLPPAGRDVQVTLNDDGEFQVFSLVDEAASEWKLHAGGKVERHTPDTPAPEPPLLAAVQARCTTAMDTATLYETMRELGLEYGPTFQGITALWRGDAEALARLQLPEAAAREVGHYNLHPALLDAALQVLGAAVPGNDNAENDIYLPVALAQLAVYSQGHTSLWAHVEVDSSADNVELVRGRLYLYDEAGRPVATIGDLRLKRASRSVLWQLGQQDLGEWLYRPTWQPQRVETNGQWAITQPGSWLVFADEQGTGATLAAALAERGERALLVRPGETFMAVQDGSWKIDPGSAADFQCLLREALPTGALGWRGVVYLWALDTRDEGALTAGALLRNQATVSGGALHLVQALAAARQESPRLWLVTRGAQTPDEVGRYPQFSPAGVAQSPLWGLGRVIAQEHQQLRCVRVDLDPATTAGDTAALLTELAQPGREDQVLWREDGRYVARLRRYESPQMRPAEEHPVQLDISARGILDNLLLRPMTRRRPGPGEVEVQVRATGLNFRDVLNALGMYPGDAGPMGGEFAGVVVAVGENVSEFQPGDEVLGMAANCFSSFITTPVLGLVRKPAGMSFTAAATIPITFLTAYYGLHELAGIQAGERVLIHAAAGGVGMAAVQLAKLAGAEIFGTAGSEAKRNYLKSLGVQHVMNSRTLDFAAEITAITGGEGVDIVLNALADEFIPRSLSVLADGGRFLEIGKRDIYTEEQVRELNPTLEYFAYDLALVSQENPQLIKSMLTTLMGMLEKGLLQPLPQQVFPLAQVADAFRYMAQAKHIGKVVVVQDEEPAALISEAGTYLISGGLGALGLKVAEALAAWGARHLALLGRNTPRPEAQTVIAELEAAGVQVTVGQVDVADREQLAGLLDDIGRTMPPLRGVIHAAGVLDDGLLVNQEWARFAAVMAPKVAGTWNLYELMRGRPLDFFVTFSSLAALFGSPGQGNYAAANAFMDELAQQSRDRFPVLSINWGPWTEVGMAAVQSRQNESRWQEQGIRGISPQPGIMALRHLLQQRARGQVGVFPVDWSQLLRQFPAGQEPPLFADLVGAREEAKEGAPAFLLQMEAAADDEIRLVLLTAHVQEQVRKVLALNATQPVDLHQGLTDMGMDSLMAVELSNRLQKSLGRTLPTTLIFEYPTVAELVAYLATEVLALASPNEKPVIKGDEINEALLQEVENLSEDEAEASLLRELQEAGY